MPRSTSQTSPRSGSRGGAMLGFLGVVQLKQFIRCGRKRFLKLLHIPAPGEGFRRRQQIVPREEARRKRARNKSRQQSTLRHPPALDDTALQLYLTPPPRRRRPSAVVVFLPPRSGVFTFPSASTFATASRTAVGALLQAEVIEHQRRADRTAASGLAMPLPGDVRGAAVDRLEHARELPRRVDVRADSPGRCCR